MVIAACWVRGTPQPPGRSSDKNSSTFASGIGAPSSTAADAPLKTAAKPVSTTSNPSSTCWLKPQSCSAGVSATPWGCLIEKPFLGETKVVVRSGKSTAWAGEGDGDGPPTAGPSNPRGRTLMATRPTPTTRTAAMAARA